MGGNGAGERVVGAAGVVVSGDDGVVGEGVVEVFLGGGVLSPLVAVMILLFGHGVVVGPAGGGGGGGGAAAAVLAGFGVTFAFGTFCDDGGLPRFLRIL